MIGLDTNVLVRLIDETDQNQKKRATKLIQDQGERGCFIGIIALCEFAWTLKRQYRRPLDEIADRIEQLLNASEFVIQNAEEASRALDSFRTDGADFADYFLAEINRSNACVTTMTFDKDASESALFTLVP